MSYELPKINPDEAERIFEQVKAKTGYGEILYHPLGGYSCCFVPDGVASEGKTREEAIIRAGLKYLVEDRLHQLAQLANKIKIQLAKNPDA